MMASFALSKKFGIMSFSKEKREDFTPDIFEDFNTEAEVTEAMASLYAEVSDTTTGYEIVYKDERGILRHCNGDPVTARLQEVAEKFGIAWLNEMQSAAQDAGTAGKPLGNIIQENGPVDGHIDDAFLTGIHKAAYIRVLAVGNITQGELEVAEQRGFLDAVKERVDVPAEIIKWYGS